MSQNEPSDDETTATQTTRTRTTTRQTQTDTTQKTTKKPIECTLDSLPEDDWPLPDRDPANTNYVPMETSSATKPSVGWRQRAKPPKSHEDMQVRFTNPVVTDDRVFVGKELVPSSHTSMPDENALYAYDRTSGKQVWTASTNDDAPRTVATKDDIVYVSTLNTLYAFGRNLGSNKWTFEPEGSLETMIPINGRIYVGTGSGLVVALRTDGSIVWTTQLDSRVTTRLAVHDGTVFVGTDNGKLTALHPTDGQKSWSKTLAASSSNDSYNIRNLAVTGCGLLGTANGNVFALTPEGAIRWRKSGRHNALSTDGENVYTGTTDGYLRALSIADGRLQWETFLGIADSQMADGIFEDPVVTDADVFVSSRPESIYSLDKKTGRKQWKMTFDSLSHMGKPVVVRDNVLVSVGESLIALT